ncbi:MAG: DNA-3-methyladenine glycosylase 2 family protein [Gemmatimonadota bacterium]|nr:DNA-3-methyladenine glycosylase 2 family protein [Gemmatimonadota bacterium]
MIHRKAIPYLKRADPVMADVIRRVGAFKPGIAPEGSHFDAVVRSIVYQQLSTKAASTIHGRLTGLFGDRPPLPHELSAMTDERLRGAGLSRQKIGYMRDLAERVVTGDVPITTLHDLSDDEVIAALTRVKGVGKWTAQMFLMFKLRRPNVLPDLDLGIQKAIKLAYGLRKMPTPDRVRRIGAKWEPYCSIASWYLWRSLDLPKEKQKPSKR